MGMLYRTVASRLNAIHFQTRGHLDELNQYATHSNQSSQNWNKAACAYVINAVRGRLAGLNLHRSRQQELESLALFVSSQTNYVAAFSDPGLRIERIKFPTNQPIDPAKLTQVTAILDCVEILNLEYADAPRESIANLCQPIAMALINPDAMLTDELRWLHADLSVLSNWLRQRNINHLIPNTTISPGSLFGSVNRIATARYLDNWTQDSFADAKLTLHHMLTRPGCPVELIPTITICIGISNVMLNDDLNGFHRISDGLDALRQNGADVTFWTDNPIAFGSAHAETYYDIARLKLILTDAFKLKNGQLTLRKQFRSTTPIARHTLSKVPDEWCDRIRTRLTAENNIIAQQHNAVDLIERALKKLNQTGALSRFYDTQPLTPELIEKKASLIQPKPRLVWRTPKVLPSQASLIADQFLSTRNRSILPNISVDTVFQSASNHIISNSMLRSKSLAVLATDYFLSHVSGQPILPQGYGQPSGMVMETCHHAIGKHEQLTSIYTQLANQIRRHAITPCPCCQTERRHMVFNHEVVELFTRALSDHLSGGNPIEPEQVALSLLATDTHETLLQSTQTRNHDTLFAQLVDLGYAIATTNTYASRPWVSRRYFGPTPHTGHPSIWDDLNIRFAEICGQNGDPSGLVMAISPEQLRFFWMAVLSDENRAVGLIQIRQFNAELGNQILGFWDPNA